MLPTKAAGAAGHTWADARVSGQLAESSAPFPKCGLAGSGCNQGAGEGGQADKACMHFILSENSKEFLIAKGDVFPLTFYSLTMKI